MTDKLRSAFDEMVVYKDLKKSNFFSTLSLPSFMRDWLLKKFEDQDGQFDPEQLLNFVRTYIPRKDDWVALKNQLVIEQERVKILAKISVDIDIKTSDLSFSLPDFDLSSSDTIIEPHVWEECKEELIGRKETWGIVELGYRAPDDSVKSQGKIKMTAFKSFCPYTIDVEYYKNARKNFTTQEWIDILLGAVDYSPSGYQDNMEMKLTVLSRLLPFIEKRLNLIELAPKGTGKSYLFGRVSRFGWLSGGGIMSRAKMFYDLNKRKEGLVSGNDFVVLDEVQTMKFTDVDEMRAALKGYMENDGVFSVADYKGISDAGIVLCGNIRKEIMDEDGYGNMFEGLPTVFRESALLDRFHGFIKGWNAPRMTEDLKIGDWALNSEYFCAILHELRDDLTYRAIVDELVEIPEEADTRDTEAIKRITTAYFKLLFPHVRNASEVDTREFKLYCLDRARKMRETIVYQLGLLDEEFRGKDVPSFSVRTDFEQKGGETC